MFLRRIWSAFTDASIRFWGHHPALLYGLALVIGFQAAFKWQWSLFLPIFFLSLPLLKGDRVFLIRFACACFVGIVSFGYIYLNHQFPHLPRQGVEGIASFEIEAVKSSKNHFGQAWIYQGKLRFFKPHQPEQADAQARQIPCRLILPQKKASGRYPADCAYLISGTLKEPTPGNYVLAPYSDQPWEPVKESWSFAEYRFQLKESFTHYLSQHIQNPRVNVFLAGIATGDFDDRLMKSEFGRFGLQHIMAISGFHFSIIAAILCFILRFVCSPRASACIVIGSLGLYMIFLGFGPSIVRAWLAIMLFFGGQIWEKRSFALNSLGVALLVVLFLDPLLLHHLGFQFSFLTTAAILFFCSGVSMGLDILLKKRPLSQLVEMDLWNQHGYVVLAFFRQALALTVAVNVIALPIMLFYFQKFPLLSLVYNFFFPFLVSVSMLFLILALLIAGVFPPIATLLHRLNDAYTSWVLNLTYNMPNNLDVYVRVEPFSAEGMIVYVTLLFLVGIWMKWELERRREDREDWAFL